jgi:hypothetical protein
MGVEKQIVYAASYKSIFLVNYLINKDFDVLVISTNLAIIDYCNYKKIPFKKIHYQKISLIKHPIIYRALLEKAYKSINLDGDLWFTHNNHDSFGFALMKLYSERGSIVNWVDLDPKTKPIKFRSLLKELFIDFPRIIRVLLNILFFRVLFNLHLSPSSIGIPKKISVTLSQRNNSKNQFYSNLNVKSEILNNYLTLKPESSLDISSCILVWCWEDFHEKYIDFNIFEKLIKVLNSLFDIVEFKPHPQYPVSLNTENIVQLPPSIPALEFIDASKVVIGLSSVVLIEAIMAGCKNVYSVIDMFPDIPKEILFDQRNWLKEEMLEYNLNGIIFIEDMEQLKDCCKKTLN